VVDVSLAAFNIEPAQLGTTSIEGFTASEASRPDWPFGAPQDPVNKPFRRVKSTRTALHYVESQSSAQIA
jgi:hypothetical protein